MPVEIIIIPAVFGIPALVVVIRMWLKHKEKMAGLAPASNNTPAIEARLSRIEQGIDAMSIEMERIGEGQRFVTKLLADRPQALPAAPLPPAGRINTPH